jgi:light-regulated signal transduction histidine kinase (bacteriophytochrome)
MLFQNLISNSIGYRSLGRKADRLFPRRRRRKLLDHSVQDNGIGFEQE